MAPCVPNHISRPLAAQKLLYSLLLTDQQSGPADQRTSGSADQRTSGSADQRISGSADQRISGPADQRISGSADQRINGSADQRISGSADQRTSGSADQRISGGPADQRIRQPHDHKSLWESSPLAVMSLESARRIHSLALVLPHVPVYSKHSIPSCIARIVV